MMKRKVLLGLCGLFLSLAPVCAFAGTINSEISVGISDNSFQRYYYSENSFYATKSLFLVEKDSGKVLKELGENEVIKVVINNNLFNVYQNGILILSNIPSPLVLKTKEDGLLGVFNLKRAGKPALYRGVIELVKPKCKENMKKAVPLNRLFDQVMLLITSSVKSSPAKTISIKRAALFRED